MRIGIITLPLHTNYGGILQAYALKSTLETLGYSPEVIDISRKVRLPSIWKRPLVYMKRIAINAVTFGNGPEVFRERRIIREFPIVSSNIAGFVSERIAPRIIEDYKNISVGDYDSLVVGSDQVWRPKYFANVEDAFLKFAIGWDIRRVAYAASFGTDQLEYSYECLEACSTLLKSFDAVSVREKDAVSMCDEWFDRSDAVHVLDPVMLLSSKDYSRLAERSSQRPCKGKILSYILDQDSVKSSVLARVEKWMDKESYKAYINDRDPKIPLQERVVPSVEEWLSCFEDAEFVVTDSFHGCVLSILFHKPFIVVGNKVRGISRIESLLEMFSLQQRMVNGLEPDDDGEYYLSPMDWDAVDVVLEQQKEKSLNFLKVAFK